MDTKKVEIPVTLSAKAAICESPNAFRAEKSSAGMLLLEFLSYCPKSESAVVVSQLQVSTDFYRAMRSELDQLTQLTF